MQIILKIDLRKYILLGKNIFQLILEEYRTFTLELWEIFGEVPFWKILIIS